MKYLPWIAGVLLLLAAVLYAMLMAFYHLVEPRLGAYYPTGGWAITDLLRQCLLAIICGLVLAGFACFTAYIVKLLSSKEDP